MSCRLTVGKDLKKRKIEEEHKKERKQDIGKRKKKKGHSPLLCNESKKQLGIYLNL